jgi:uracil-DNA glycosylase
MIQKVAEKLEKLKIQMQKENLPLKEGATQLVFGKGNTSPTIFFIGEAPGEKEDLAGEPFIGAAGKRLNVYLESINLAREDCYISNIVKYRPPNNRDPKIEEINAHAPFLVEEIKIVNPKIIVPLGRFATAFILAGFSSDKDKLKLIDPITQTHGKAFQIDLHDQKYTVIPTFHPAASLYNPKLRTKITEDFQTVKRFATVNIK